MKQKSKNDKNYLRNKKLIKIRKSKILINYNFDYSLQTILSKYSYKYDA